jgi:hypothetical protein
MRIKRFDEANLNLKELDKKQKDGELRGQKLVKKLRDDGEFTVSKGKEETDVKFINADDVADNITNPSDQFDQTKAKNFLAKGKNYTKVFQGDDLKDYKLNDLKKDEYFGSSGGSSLGFEKTRLVESLQCLFLALKQSLITIPKIGRFHTSELFDDEGNIDSEILRYVRIPIEIDGEFLSDFIKNDKDGWVDTLLNTANALYNSDLQLVGKNQRTVFKTNKKYVFHQIGVDSPLMKELLRSYDGCAETEDTPIAKWTPSDIWAVELNRQQTIINEIRDSFGIKELNDIINKRFMRSQMIGVSLKKVGGEESIKLVINKLTPAPRYYFDKIITSVDPLGSIGVKLVAKFTSEVIKDGSETLYLRSFSGGQTTSDISGEVEGQHSRYGKIGLNWINSIFSECGVLKTRQVPTKNQISSNVELYTDEYLLSEINRINATIPNKSRTTTKRISGRPSLISKYQSLKFAELITQLSKEGIKLEPDENVYASIADKVTEDIFYYAMSIQNYDFECPMYVRIVTNKSEDKSN